MKLASPFSVLEREEKERMLTCIGRPPYSSLSINPLCAWNKGFYDNDDNTKKPQFKLRRKFIWRQNHVKIKSIKDYIHNSFMCYYLRYH